VVAAIGQLGLGGLQLQAATGLAALIVLMIVLNWFFHRVYWTGWISSPTAPASGSWAARGRTRAAT
jgi:high-affinity iron transporter